ncbi:PREDICTED: galactosylceramide sulfotransferase-like [Cyprinodon variegatus]|uniref:Galactose-3-O-sulfotransferase 1b n=1 Tax=Cyprinodon variegatus TaxID=28743 RepID=A0A3Q2G5F1_CYPVA|nr:PREDICTED: galactosylceramide sulfotransferase-like [Cyprinodon variegatus]
MLWNKGFKCTAVVRRLIPWVLMTNIMLVLYCLKTTNHVNIRPTQEETCPLSMAKTNHAILSESSKPKQKCSPKVNIMFMKTHKTASSTILNILFRFGEKHKLKFALPDRRNDFCYPQPFLRFQVKDYKPGQCFNIVCNHMRFNHQEVAKLLPPDAVYVTILRDPVDLFESAFHYYHRAVPLTWGISGKNKLTEFLNNPEAFYSPEAFNSFYLKNLLFFDFGFNNNLGVNDPRIMEAIHSLSQRFHLVLIAEYFEESLILLKDLLCWSMEDILYFKLNARRTSSVNHLDPEMRVKALQWNWADWKLYEHFNATFWQKVEAYGRERMEQDVKELRRRNAEMRAICVDGGDAVEAQKIKDTCFRPWQPVGEKSIMGYNLRKDIDPKWKTICGKMLTPEIQYLSDMGVNLWVTRLWGWLKDSIF